VWGQQYAQNDSILSRLLIQNQMLAYYTQENMNRLQIPVPAKRRMVEHEGLSHKVRRLQIADTPGEEDVHSK
jgi:hypothetical protein